MEIFYKEKLKDLINKRTSLFTYLLVLISGVCGLFFLNITIIKLILFLSIGIYYICVLLLNIKYVENNIFKVLEELKNVGK